MSDNSISWRVFGVIVQLMGNLLFVCKKHTVSNYVKIYCKLNEKSTTSML